MGTDQLFEHRDTFASQFIRQKARHLVRQRGFHSSEQRDIEQELTLDLLRKYPCFDPQRARETTFIARVVENRIVSLVRARRAEKRDFKRDGTPLSETVLDPDGIPTDRASLLDEDEVRRHTGQTHRSDIDQAELALDVAAVLDELPDDLRRLAGLLTEMTEHAASGTLDRSRRQVAADVARLREAFEAADLRDYL